MSSRTRLLVLLVSTPVVAFVLVGGFLGNVWAGAPGQDSYRHLRVFEDVVQLILSSYVEEVEIGRVLEGAMRGLSDSLDPDSAYLTADEVQAIGTGEKLPEGDVGIALTRQYYLRIVAVRDGSPAASAGLQTGDYLRGIDGLPTRDLSVFEGVRLLRGQPGTTVSLTVIRGNAADPHVVELVRERPRGPDVTGQMVRPHVGLVRVAAFGPTVTAALAEQVGWLTRAGATHLVIDVRRTAEGDLVHGLEAARLFVAAGTLAVLEERGKASEPITTQAGDGAITVPVALLTSNGTSGAAEIFVAALAGNRRAEVVGERTHGRAGLQKLVPLPEGRGLWMTYARYSGPAGDPIANEGIAPTVEVAEPEVEFGAERPDSDRALETALERIAGKPAA